LNRDLSCLSARVVFADPANFKAVLCMAQDGFFMRRFDENDRFLIRLLLFLLNRIEGVAHRVVLRDVLIGRQAEPMPL